MTELEIIKRVEQMCVKNGDISVQYVDKFGGFQLVVPVIVGDDEFEPEQIATFDLECSIEDDGYGRMGGDIQFPSQVAHRRRLQPCLRNDYGSITLTITKGDINGTVLQNFTVQRRRY